jgi:hypothetical protein
VPGSFCPVPVPSPDAGGCCIVRILVSCSLFAERQYTDKPVKKTMQTKTRVQFEKELDNFFRLILLNMVFGALAVASGLQYILVAVLEPGGLPASPFLRIVTGATALVCFGLGLFWVRTSARVLKEIRQIRRETRGWTGQVPDDVLTDAIVRMIAHYRENKKTLRIMTYICTLGAVCFFIMGIAASLEFLRITGDSLTFSMSSFLVIPAMALTLGAAAASIACTYFFTKHGRTWDSRLTILGMSEETLEKALGAGSK